MKNRYLKNLSKIEFVVTDACTGRCKHCSQGDHASRGDSLDPTVAADAVKRIAEVYDIQTVMAFGGEPLLYPETVYAVMRAARESNIPRLQVITNGYFARDREQIRAVAERLCACGVNDLLLSVDAFHGETIPLDTVRMFAEELVRCGIPVRLSPAWLVNRLDDNHYNRITREILERFHDLAIPVGEGNVIFPEGNAFKYLAEYFTDTLPENPYVEAPRDVRCVSFEPNGDVLGGNVYEQDIMEIINNYSVKEIR